MVERLEYGDAGCVDFAVVEAEDRDVAIVAGGGWECSGGWELNR